MKTARILMIASLVCLLVAGCKSFADNAYKTLYAAGQTYDAGMKTVAELQSQGEITDDQRAEINKYATKFYASYRAASVALSVYNKTRTAADKEKLTVAIRELIASWKVFADAVNVFVPDLIKTEVNG